MRTRRWRAVDRQTPAPVQRGHRPLGLVGSPAASLIDSTRLRADAVAIARAAVAAIDPFPLVTASLHQHSDIFERLDQIGIVAAGKAAGPMASAAYAVLGTRVTCGVVTALPGSWSLPHVIDAIPGSHPLPDQYSELAATRALEIAATIRHRRGLLLALLSGGGSAMLALPIAGIALEDKRITIDALSQAGVPIADINCVRKHLSAIKGGRLAEAVEGNSLTLAISDVHAPPDDRSTIASGPTAPDPSTFAEAAQIVDAAGANVPAPVRVVLKRGVAGEIPETPKAEDSAFRTATFLVIANRHTAVEGAARYASEQGYLVRVIDAAITGEAAAAGEAFVDAALATLTSGGPGCAIASGETTVTVRGAGRGGRNQEFVLGAARALAHRRVAAVVCSAGTDGIDGPTDAAGGVVSSHTIDEARARGLDLERALSHNDAYAALDALGALVRWGPTHTNVGDVHVLLKL